MGGRGEGGIGGREGEEGKKEEKNGDKTQDKYPKAKQSGGGDIQRYTEIEKGDNE